MVLYSWVLQLPPNMQTAFVWKGHSHGRLGFYFFINYQFKMGFSDLERCHEEKNIHREEFVEYMTVN